MFMVFSADVIL